MANLKTKKQKIEETKEVLLMLNSFGVGIGFSILTLCIYLYTGKNIINFGYTLALIVIINIICIFYLKMKLRKLKK